MLEGRDRRLTAGQVEALAAIPNAASAPLEVGSYRIPASNYTDPAYFERERKAIFNRHPVVAGPSDLLPHTQSFQRLELLGRPILLTRAADGVARAFLNVCRHRGAVLVPGHELGCGNRLTCPYHAWTYGLDGKLHGVPRSEIFEDFDKADYGLTSLPCREAGGLIWVGLLADGGADFTEAAGDLALELDALGLGEMCIFDKKTYPVRANWKLVMDTMLDSYHVIRLHKNTLAKYFTDSPTDVRAIGPHIRSTSGRGNFSGSTISDDFQEMRRVSVFAYTIFPTGVVVVSPDYINVGILRPVSFERTDVDYYMLTEKTGLSAVKEDKLRRSFDLMDRAFGKEDFWAAELSQEGLSAGSLEHLLAGGMERQMHIFHETIDKRLNACREALA